MTVPQTSSFRPDGQRALVAGAFCGIGSGCAVGLGNAAADNTPATRSADKLARAVARALIEAGTPGGPVKVLKQVVDTVGAVVHPPFRPSSSMTSINLLLYGGWTAG